MDLFLFQQINQYAGKLAWLDVLGIVFAKYLEYILVFFLFLFLVINFKKYWKMIVRAFISAIFARFVIVNLIRLIWHRPRPFVENLVNLLIEQEKTAAFPSGHAAFYFAISTVVFLYLIKLKPRPKYWQGISIGFFLSSFLISLARVFSGLHWPSDILAGAVVGIFSGWLVMFISRKFSSGAKKL